jgi:hypothetical protein
MVAITYAKSMSGSGLEAIVRLYDPVTQNIGGEIVANQTNTNDQSSPSIVSLKNGNFIVLWDSNDNGGMDQSGYGAWGRVFDATGKVVTNEFLLNTSTPNNQHLPVVVARDGGFAAVFIAQNDTAPGAGTYGIYVQYFDNEGSKVGQQMQVNQLVTGDQVQVDATFMEDGQLFVSWTDKGVGDTNGSAVKGRLVDLEETLGLPPIIGGGDVPGYIDYRPVSDAVGTSGHDVMDARGYSTASGGDGDDVIVVDGGGFTRVDGGEGRDTVVWDAYSNLDISAIANKLNSIEAVHLGNNISQVVSVNAVDVLEVTGADENGDHILRITGDTGNAASGSRDAVNIDVALWTAGSATSEAGVTYSVYTSTEDQTVKLWIQSGLTVV